MLAEIEARLAAQAPSLKKVFGASEFAAVKANPPKNLQPAAYVVPLRETPDRNRVAVNAVRQRNTVRFAVILALGNLSDRRGGTATRALEAVRLEVKTALVGWVPVAEAEMVEFAGAGIVERTKARAGSATPS